MPVAALIWVSGLSAQSAPKVAFIMPAPEGASVFWTLVSETMQAAAEDLGIDLRIVYSRNNSYSQKKDGLAALNSPNRPDFFLTGYWVTSTQHHIKRAEELRVRTFVINSAVAHEERREMGRPRDKYRYWIGQLTPDDQQAAYTLTDLLISKAKAAGKTDKSGKVHLIVIGGDGIKNSVEEKRYSGIRQRIAERGDAVLKELLLTGWEGEIAYNELLGALKRHPETGAIWSITDITALSALDAVRDLGKKPGEDIFIGCFNWSLEAINEVIAGKIAATMGGHFLEGVKALVLIHDYHYGMDFEDESGLEMLTSLEMVTADNAEEYLHKMSAADWRKVDFKQFSKKYNAGIKSDNLTLDALFKLMLPES